MIEMSIPDLLSERNSSLLDSGLQHAWDSTSLGSLKECPRKYYYQIIQGWRSRGESIHLEFGLYYHSALETYDKEIAHGRTHSEAQREMVRRALKDCWRPKLSAPWHFLQDKNKNQWTLIRAIVWYTEHFKNDVLETYILANGEPAVELSFTFDSGLELDNHPISLCGHLDKIVTMGEDPYVTDKKTTGSTLGDYYYSRFNVDNQFTLYSIAGKVIFDTPVKGVIVDALQSAGGFSRFGRNIQTRSKPIIEEWWMDLEVWLGMASMYARQRRWPKNDKSCFLCDYKRVCASPPSLREGILKTDFFKYTWDPLERR